MAWLWLSAVVALAAQSATVPPSQLPALSRVEQLAEYVFASTWCERIGYELSSDFAERLEVSARSFAGAYGVEPATVDRWSGEALQRQERIMRGQYDRAIELHRETGELDLVREVLGRMAERCAAFAADPDLEGVLVPPPDPEAGLIAAMDALLAPAGQATWQTAEMVAKSDLLFAVGACNPVLSAARRAAYLSRLLPASLPEREGLYLSQAYQDGLAAAARLSMTSAECERVLVAREEAIE